MKIVIVGASFSGVSCAVEARKNFPNDEIVLIDKQPDIGYIPSGLSLVLKGAIPSLEDAYFINQKELEQIGITLCLDTCVTEFQLANHLLITNHGEITFDKLVLATGSSQVPKNLDMSDKEGLTFKDKQTSAVTLNKIQQSKDVIVIGAGQAGLELSDALIQAGKVVEVIETMNYPLYKYFDKDFLQPFINELKEESSLKIYFEETINTLSEQEVIASNLKKHKGQGIPVILATSVRPNLAIFKKQLQLTTEQTIYVDKYLRTSQPDVFAIGDLIQVPSSVLPMPTYVPLINTAVQTGITCAKNLKKAIKPLQPVCQTVGTHLFGSYLGSCGLLEAESFVYPGDVASYTYEMNVSFTSKDVIRKKILYDANSFVLLGVQLLSSQPVADKINQYALMINQKMVLSDIEWQEKIYHPEFTYLKPDLYINKKRVSDDYEI